MVDQLEKVKKGLKCCLHITRDCPQDCPYERMAFCRDHLHHDALELINEQKNLIDGLIEDQLKKDEEQQAEIKRLKILAKKKNRKIKKLMEDNYLNGGR